MEDRQRWVERQNALDASTESMKSTPTSVATPTASASGQCRPTPPSSLSLLPLKPILVDRGHNSQPTEADMSSPEQQHQHKKRVTLQ